MFRPAWWVSVPATVLLPLAVALVTVVTTFAAARGQPDARPLDAVGIALLLAGAALLVVRRANPPAVVGAAALFAGGYFAAGYPAGPVFLAAVVALCSAVVTGHRRSVYTVTAAAFLLLLALHIIRFPGAELPLFGATGWLSTLVTIIAGAELWRARSERLEQLQITRAEAERRKATEERLRIARELHDSLGHHVSLINVQAGVALYLLDDDREQAAARWPRSLTPAASCCARCAPPWGSCAASTRNLPGDRWPAWPVSTTWPRRAERRGWR